MPDNWELVEFEPEHGWNIADKNMRSQEDWMRSIDLKKWCWACKTGGPAYTLMVDGEPVACAGIILQEWNRGEAWSLLSTLFKRHKVKVYRAMKSGLDSLITVNKLRRVQSLVDPRFPKAIDLIECLGFEFEGRLKAYGPFGEDYFLYARTQS